MAIKRVIGWEKFHLVELNVLIKFHQNNQKVIYFANMFMEQLEQKLSATVPEDLRPKLCNRYVDDTLEVVKRGTVDKLM